MNKYFIRTLSLFLIISLLLSLGACSVLPGKAEQPDPVQDPSAPADEAAEPSPEVT